MGRITPVDGTAEELGSIGPLPRLAAVAYYIQGVGHSS